MDHYLGRFDDGNDGISLLELEFVGATASDDAFDQVVPNTNHDMSHNVAELNFFNRSVQFVSS